MTAWASDDLASVLIAPDAEFAGWGQGIIKSWDPDTFESVISYRGGEHSNIPVASGIEALTYVPGDVVMLSRWQPTGGGAVSLRIGAGGRVIIPGTGAAEQAIAFMRTTLAKSLSAEIFAERISQDTLDNNIGFRNNTSYGNLGDGLGGTYTDQPQVPNVEVTEAGVMFVDLSVGMTVDLANGRHGFFSYDVSGPTSRSANDAWSFELGVGGDTALSVVPSASMTKRTIQTGLTAGTYTITGKFRTLTTDGDVSFANPTLIVTAF